MTKFDWNIHAVTGTYMTDTLINLHTHGLKRHGLTDLSMIIDTRVCSVEQAGTMINTVANMMVKGESFVPEIIHYIDKPDGTNDFKFYLKQCKCFDEDSLRMIIPDKNGKFLWELKEDEDLEPSVLNFQYNDNPNYHER